MTGLPATRPADCMTCGVKRVPCMWVMRPLFWRHCHECHEVWEASP